jgi:hypothetical protein
LSGSARAADYITQGRDIENVFVSYQYWYGRRARRAPGGAVELLAPMLERKKDDAAYLSRMGLYVVHLDQPRAALDWITLAAAAAPASPDVQFRAAVASELAGARSAAIGHLLRAKKLGYPARLIDSEPDLVALRRDPHYTSPSLVSQENIQ